MELFISRINTFLMNDEKKNAAFLTEGSPNFDILRNRQKAVEELIKKKELALNLEIYSMIIGNVKENINDEWYDKFLKYIALKKKFIVGV